MAKNPCFNLASYQMKMIREKNKDYRYTAHLIQRALLRGVKLFEVDALRKNGVLVRIQYPRFWNVYNSFRYVLHIPRANGQIVEGVFVIEDAILIGITVYVISAG